MNMMINKGYKSMAILAELKCTVCRSGDDPMSKQEIGNNLESIPEWELINENKTDKLKRTFNFQDFATAVDFSVAIAKFAETEGHHPQISTEWGKSTVRWWTHKIGGLHKNDFIMAAKTSRAYKDAAYEKILRK